MSIEDTGPTSPRRSIREANHEAAQRMAEHAARADTNVGLGDRGIDFFRGRCEVVGVDGSRITIRSEASGKKHTVHRVGWLGLILDADQLPRVCRTCGRRENLEREPGGYICSRCAAREDVEEADDADAF